MLVATLLARWASAPATAAFWALQARRWHHAAALELRCLGEAAGPSPGAFRRAALPRPSHHHDAALCGCPVEH